MPALSSLSRRTLLALTLGGAVLLAAALIGASLLGGSESAPAEPQPVTTLAGEAEESEESGDDSLLRGIPQDGIVLGTAKAPVTLVEFADIQCSYCAVWARDAFPTVVDEYVRPGKVRIVFRGLAFLGPESDTALRAVLAAGEQDALWNVLHGLMVRQGVENSGWVTQDLLRGLARGAGIDAELMLEQSSAPAVERTLAAARAAAQKAGVPGTPFFQAGPTGGVLQTLQVQALDADAFRAELDRLLAA
jgi:protein-disulfide isomerase